jgi:capsular exopolysaccharide synthesis family protein
VSILSTQTNASNALISHSDPKSPVVEAFRTLRTNLQYINAGESLRKLLITSPGPGEGKSTIAANLGYLLAQSGKKVIVVSADLRKPTVHKILQMPNRQGLTNILAGLAKLDDCLAQVPLIDNLQFLASGPTPPNPAELLGSENMNMLIAELERRADIVVFDAPPVVAVTDAAVMAPKMDGTVLVINVGAVPRELAVRSKAQLEAVGARVVGAILNRVDVKAGYGYYYYYYYSNKDDKGTAV